MLTRTKEWGELIVAVEGLIASRNRWRAWSFFLLGVALWLLAERTIL